MTGPQRGPLLVHGFAGSAESWSDEIVGGLSAAGLPPELVDLPGHGRSMDSGPEVGAAPTLAAALDTIDRAVGSPPIDLVGYSMGGRIALHFALANPGKVGRLVLESSSPGLATEVERAARRDADEELARFLVERGIEAFVDRWEGQPLFASRASIDPGERARQRALRLRNRPTALAAALRGLGTGSLPSLWERLAEVAVPTLLLVGELDGKFVRLAEQMASRLPDARVVVVGGAGHSVHLERPADWLAAVTAFVSGPARSDHEKP